MLQFLHSFERETLTITLENGSLGGLLALYNEVKLRGQDVRDCRLKLGTSWGRSNYMNTTDESENAVVDWNALFVHLPGLKRLDLRKTPRGSRFLPAIVSAAAKHCLQLEILVLPQKAPLEMNADRPENLMMALYPALEQWQAKGNYKGIRQLTVPTRSEGDRYRCSTEFIEAVTHYCPNIQFLDGPQVVIQDNVKCEDRWVISVDTWEKFNRTCTGLRAFHWAAVPFADPYFQVFGEYPKPQLKDLTISANLLWDWKEYFLACGDTDAAADRASGKDGYGRRAKNVEGVFKGCPGLTSITVALDLHAYAEAACEHFNIDVFGDTFWITAAANCPLLESIRIENATPYEDDIDMRLEPIQTFTDASLLKLAELEFLSSVEIYGSVMCTGDGIFEYLRCMSTSKAFESDWMGRCLCVHVGGQPYGHFGQPLFYTAAITVLRRLTEISEEELGAAASRYRTTLTIANPYRSVVSRKWSVAFMRDQLKPLLEKLKTMHPALFVSITVNRRVEDSFARIAEFRLSWHSIHTDQKLFNDEIEGNLYQDPNVDMAEGLAGTFGPHFQEAGRDDIGEVVASFLRGGNHL